VWDWRLFVYVWCGGYWLTHVLRDNLYPLSRLPHVGQNLWFYLDCVDDVRSLCENLHPLGVRESVLKEEMTKSLDAVIKSISSTPARYVIVTILTCSHVNTLSRSLNNEHIARYYRWRVILSVIILLQLKKFFRHLGKNRVQKVSWESSQGHLADAGRPDKWWLNSVYMYELWQWMSYIRGWHCGILFAVLSCCSVSLCNLWVEWWQSVQLTSLVSEVCSVVWCLMPGVTVPSCGHCLMIDSWCRCAVSRSLFAVCSSTVDETKNVDNMIEGTRKASDMFTLNFLTLFQFYQCLCGIYTGT